MNRRGYKTAYYLREIEKWQESIKALKLENCALKDRLSEKIRGEVQRSFVEEAENMQQKFIEKDQVMDLLRQDIHSLLTNLSPQGITNAYKKQFLLLEKDLEKFIFEFHRMKVFFSNFLSSK